MPSGQGEQNKQHGVSSATYTARGDCNACDRTFEVCLSWDHIINAVALRIRETLELGDILQATVDEVHRLLECDRVLIYQFEPDWSGRVVVESVSQPQWSLIDQVVRDPCFESSWLEPYREKRYFAIEDIAKADLAPCHAEFLASFQVQANLVIPILKENNLWGLMIAHHCQAPRPWKDVEIEGLQLLAVQVGIAIHQAALIDQLKATNTTLEAEVAARTCELMQANHTLREVNQKLIAKIQERNQVAAEVLQREAFLQQVLDSLFAFVGVMTPDGILIEANQAPLEMAGLTRDDVLGKPFAEAYWWAYSPEAQTTIRSAIAIANQGGVARFDIPLQIQGDQLITIDFALTPLRNQKTGEITHLIPSGVDISDRLRAEADRTRLLDVLEASLNEIYLFRADTLNFEYANQGALRNLGYSLDQLQQMTAVDIKPDLALPDFETLVAPLRRQAVAKVNFETVHQRADGSCYPVDVLLQLTQKGQEPCFLAVILDITERKQAETERLQDQIQLQQLGTIVASSHDAIISKTPDGIVTSWNKAAEVTFGYTAEEMIGQPITTIIPPEHRAEAAQILAQIRQGQRVETYETQRRHKDGQLVDVSLTISPIYDENGHVIGASKIARNITAQKRAERLSQQAENALRSSQERFQRFMDNAPLLSWIISREGRVEYGNDAWFTFSGWSKTAALGQTLEDLFPAEFVQAHHESNQRVLQTGQVIETIEPGVDPEGTLHTFLVRKFPVYAKGEITAVGGIAIDVTQQQQAEALIRDQAETLRIFYETSPLLMGLVEISENDILHLSDNPAALSFFGLTAEELANHWASEVGLSAEAIQRWLTHYRQSQQQQRPVQFNYTHVTPTNQHSLLVTVSFVGQGDSGRPRYSYIMQDLTEKKQLEREKDTAIASLEDSEQRYASLVAAVPVGIFRADATGQCVYVNEWWESMTGMSLAQAIGEGWGAITHPEDQAQVLTAWTTATQTQQRFELEYRLQAKTGRVVWVYGQAVAEYTAAGEILGYVGTITDITEHKQIEAERQRAQQTQQELSLLEQILDIVLAGYWDWHIAADEEYLSPGLKQMLGYEDHELPNAPQTWQDLIFLEDLPRVLEQFDRHIQSHGAEPYNNEVRYRHKDGSTVWILCSGKVIEWDEAGNPLRMIGCHIDITKRKQAETALQESEARYRNIIETTLEGVWILDAEGKTTFVNQRMAEMLGHDVETMQHQSFLDFMTPEDQAQAQDYFARRQEGIKEQHSFKFCCQDGSELWTLISGTPTFDQDGTYQGVIGLLTDVTALINTQEALKQSELKLSSILNSSLDGIMAFRSIRDDQDKIIDFEWTLSNPTACQSVNKPLHELIGQHLLEVLPGNRTDGLFDLYVQVVETGDPVQRQFHYQHDGIDTWFEKIAVPLGDGFAVTFRDISAVKSSEKALQQANSALEIHLKDLRQRNDEMLMLSETSDFLQACRSLDEACTVISTLVQPLFPDCSGSFHITSASRNRVEAVASWGDGLYSVKEFHSHDCWALRRGRWHTITPNRPGLRCNHITAAPPDLTTLCIPMIAQGETLGMFYLSTQNPEVLNQAKQQLARTLAEQVGLAIANLNLRETLQSQSIRDGLTGLFNRRYLEEALQSEIVRAQRYHYSTAVVMVDVDHFKLFNDQHGHDAGDLVLKTIAQALQDHVRGSDIACRYGGEELILVLPETSLIDAVAKAEEVRVAISQINMTYGGQTLAKLTASFGVAVFPDHGTTAATVIQAADAALYQAKGAGRNQVVVANNNPEVNQ